MLPTIELSGTSCPVKTLPEAEGMTMAPLAGLPLIVQDAVTVSDSASEAVATRFFDPPTPAIGIGLVAGFCEHVGGVLRITVQVFGPPTPVEACKMLAPVKNCEEVKSLIAVVPEIGLALIVQFTLQPAVAVVTWKS